MNKDIHPNVKWVNSLVGRILYDCIRSPEFIDKVKERIQKKLSAIKLPYFIEALAITELNLGEFFFKLYTCKSTKSYTIICCSKHIEIKMSCLIIIEILEYTSTDKD